MDSFECEICRENGLMDCKDCFSGNPCLKCDDYDYENDKCKSNGGCGNENSN